MPAYYAKTAGAFVTESATSVIGELLNANTDAQFAQLETAQAEVRRDQIAMLQGTFCKLSSAIPDSKLWAVLLEFPIPRRQRRVDAVVLARDVVFVIEFKATTAERDAFEQVEDYALDLADFHEGSKNLTIVPIVVAPKYRKISVGCASDPSRVRGVIACRPDELVGTLAGAFHIYSDDGHDAISLTTWNNAQYHPVPTIVEAATAVFAGMEVREIAHSHCDAHNLTSTVDAVIDAVVEAKRNSEKLICFVTGVPGSGKTLAGLQAVHDPRTRTVTESDPAFFSGNGPLVSILREALVRDRCRRTGASKREVRRQIETSIQNVHVFARNHWADEERRAPHEKLLVFDEAQRAWNAKRNLRKFRRDISEPEMILSIMDRHPDWAALICLVGGGQEIHDGEAGLAEWGRALSTSFTHWRVIASPEAVHGGESVAGTTLFDSVPAHLKIREMSSLHLPVSTRAYRAEAITAWSNAFLNGDRVGASKAISGLSDFPLYLTRSLDEAKRWLRERTRGTARCGLVASSGAARLRAHGLETSTAFHRDYPYEYWFLNSREDVRSSYQLEVVATEFEIQGLELDWIGLCWDVDLAWNPTREEWQPRWFSGTTWKTVKNHADATFIKNSYRVLLTRARQGTVIWVPMGDDSDPTRDPKLYDELADFIIDCGVRPL